MSLNQNNIDKYTSVAPSAASQFDSQSNKSSLRSLRVSQNDGYFSQKRNEGIGESVKKDLQKKYELLNKGKISKEEFQKNVKQDLGLKTNEYFDKALNKLEVNFAEMVRGIDKNFREENQNLKPNTCDPSIITGYEKTISVGKFQQKFVPLPNFIQNDQIQQKCLEEVEKLRSGKLNPIQFQKQLEAQGLFTGLIERELRELNSSNTASYTKINQGIYRALEEQRSRQQNASLIGLNDNPLRGDAEYNKQANEHRVNFDKPNGGEDKENTALEKQLRTLSIGNVYNELKKPAGENVLAAKNNGDILAWAKDRDNQIPVIEKEVARPKSQFNKSTIKLEDNTTVAVPEQPSKPLAASKKRNFNQMESSRNILAYESEPMVSPKTNIKMLQGSGNIITWKK